MRDGELRQLQPGVGKPTAPREFAELACEFAVVLGAGDGRHFNRRQSRGVFIWHTHEMPERGLWAVKTCLKC
jgi:hypothetical protein